MPIVQILFNNTVYAKENKTCTSKAHKNTSLWIFTKFTLETPWQPGHVLSVKFII